MAALKHASITVCGNGSSFVPAATSSRSARGFWASYLATDQLTVSPDADRDRLLVHRRQGIERLVAAVERQRRAAFPPAGIVVVRRDLVEAELLVVVRTDPLGRIDRALLERRIDVAAGDLLRHHAELRHDLAGEAADAQLQALQVVDRLDLLAEPAAHLGAGMAHQEGGHLVFLVELAHQLEPAAEIDPRIVLAGVEAERQRGVEGEGRILADIVVGRGVAALDRLVLDGVDDLQAGDDLAGGEDADLELVVGEGRDALGEELAGAVDRVERLGKLDAMRHFTSGIDWATAGAARAPAAATVAPPTPAVRMNLRRCIVVSP